MDKSLILLSALYKPESIEAVETQVVSLFLEFKKDSVDILIITQTQYHLELDSRLKKFGLPIQYFIVDARTPIEASSAKLRVFEYPNINEYSKVLYLDSAVLLYNPIDPIFQLDLEPSKVYAIEEGWVTHPWWGGDLFHPNSITKTMTGFSSSLLLFQVNDTMKQLFSDMRNHIEENKNKKHVDTLDQPYIIVQAITQKKYDNQLLKKLNEEKSIFLRVSRLPNVYNKMIKINEYMRRIYTRLITTIEAVPEDTLLLNNVLQGKHYCLKQISTGFIGSIDFSNSKVTVHLGPNSFWGSYTVLNNSTCQVNYGNQDYVLRFNADKSFFISIRKSDLAINHASLE